MNSPLLHWKLSKDYIATEDLSRERGLVVRHDVQLYEWLNSTQIMMVHSRPIMITAHHLTSSRLQCYRTLCDADNEVGNVMLVLWWAHSLWTVNNTLYSFIQDMWLLISLILSECEGRDLLKAFSSSVSVKPHNVKIITGCFTKNKKTPVKSLFNVHQDLCCSSAY